MLCIGHLASGPHQRAHGHDGIGGPSRGPQMRNCNRPTSTSMEAHPARTLRGDTRKRERVRCSPLVDWPVYPRLGNTMRGSEWARNSGRRSAPGGLSPFSAMEVAGGSALGVCGLS
jgi:hypothetical protein